MFCFFTHRIVYSRASVSHPAGSHATPEDFIKRAVTLKKKSHDASRPSFLYLQYLHTWIACDYQHTRNCGVCLKSAGTVLFLLLGCLQRAIAVSMTRIYWRCEGKVLTRGSKYLWKITAAWTNALRDEWSFMTEWVSEGFNQIEWERWISSLNAPLIRSGVIVVGVTLSIFVNLV